MKIYRRLVAYSLFLIVLPLIMMSAIMFARTRRLTENETVATYGHVIDVYLTSVAHKARAYEMVMQQLMVNETLGRVLLHEGEIDQAYLGLGRDLTNEIARLMSGEMRREVHLVSVYTDNLRAAVASGNVVLQDSALEPARAELLSVQNWAQRPVTRATTTPGLRLSTITMLGPVLNYDPASLFRRIAAIQLDILAEAYFDNAMPSDDSPREVGVYVYSDAGKSVYSRGIEGVAAADVWQTMTGADRGGAEYQVATYGGLPFFVIESERTELGLRYAFVFPMGEFRQRLATIILQTLLSFGVGVALFAGISIALTKPYNERLRRLIEKISAIRDGALRDEPPIGGSDEISLVDSHLTSMVVRLRQLIKTVYEEELMLKEAQLTALESQITPHFLFNTLELINSIATVYDNEEICVITEKLGRILRYNIASNASHWTSLRDEVSIVRDYLGVYQLRYEGTCLVEIDVDRNAQETMVPRFILQPLMENSLIHGFANRSGSKKIGLSACLLDDELELVIRDNGAGMDGEQKQELEALMQRAVAEAHPLSKRDGRIGIMNVYLRLVLTYGDDFRMSFESEKGLGTEVRIVLPVRRPEATRVQSADR